MNTYFKIYFKGCKGWQMLSKANYFSRPLILRTETRQGIRSAHNGKLVSPTAREKCQFTRIINKRSGLCKVAMDLVRATERKGQGIQPQSWKVAENTICGRKHV